VNPKASSCFQQNAFATLVCRYTHDSFVDNSATNLFKTRCQLQLQFSAIPCQFLFYAIVIFLSEAHDKDCIPSHTSFQNDVVRQFSSTPFSFMTERKSRHQIESIPLPLSPSILSNLSDSDSYPNLISFDLITLSSDRHLTLTYLKGINYYSMTHFFFR